MLTDRIAALHADLDALLTEDLVGIGAAELTAAMQLFEAFKCRLPVADHRFIGEVDDRRLAAEVCVTSTSVLLQQLLRLTPGEAAARVRAAGNLGPRRTLHGEVLDPLFARVAAAQQVGLISHDHARVIVWAVDHLPADLQAECEQVMEAQLIEHARSFDPGRLLKLAKHLHYVLDPDGTLADDADHARRREFVLVKHRDGSAETRTYIGPDVVAIIEAFLDTHAAPQPAVDGTPDRRTVGQRNYDAIQAGFTHLMTCGPATAPGKPDKPAGTLILTMTVDQFQDGHGWVTTPHGDLVPVPTALQLVDGGHTMSVLFDPHGGILDYGRSRRLVPPDMRLALTARDTGCSFPGCTRPAGWDQAHHFLAFALGGPTSVGNTGLVCSWHHREFGRRGWTGQLINGRPHWTPPKFIDQHQTPIRNTAHDPPMRL